MSDNRGTCWSVTINNPTQDDEDFLELARQRGWKIDGQREVGKEGTPHYQLIVKTPQVRFSAVKKAFPRAHIELARNSKALETYVHKEDTRAGELPSQADRYPSQKRYFELVWEVINSDPEGYNVGPSGRFRGERDAPRNALVKATKVLIRRGYVVESMAVNPMTLSAWNCFHDDFRVRAQNFPGETKSQTDASPRLDEASASVVMEHNLDAVSSQVHA